METLKVNALRRYLLEQDLMFLAGQPVVYHCHHFNLFLDQTIDDALGPEASARLRMAAGREFAGHLLSAVGEHAAVRTPPERLQLAAQLFKLMGHGTLDFDADGSGGTAYGSHLHYGTAWVEKYGKQVRRRHPADAFAAGFAAAAAEFAYDLSPGSLASSELSCVALRDPQCRIAIGKELLPDPVGAVIGEQESEQVVGPPEDGLFEDLIHPITLGLKEFTAGVQGDERGLVQAFGVFVTMHLAGYYNRISYDAVAYVERHAPQSVGVLEDLLRESGHVCVFNTFGGILLSPEWEGLVGAPKNDPEKIVAFCMAIGRALGMGHWTIAEFEPERRLVFRTSSSYETVYYRTRHGNAERAVEYLFQGAALATAQLVHRVDWEARPQLTPEYYKRLFKGGVPWRAEQHRSIARGDSVSEIVVTKVGA
jgi:hypothetical protein